MTHDEMIEAVARIIDPSSWRVMDSEKASMLRKYKGRNVGWPPDQFQHKESMAKAQEIIAVLQADAAPISDRLSTSNPVDDHETGNVSDKLRDASKVAHEVCEEMEEYGPHFATKVIKADRQAVRLAERQKIVAWLRETERESLMFSGYGFWVADALEAGEYER